MLKIQRILRKKQQKTITSTELTETRKYVMQKHEDFYRRNKNKTKQGNKRKRYLLPS